MNAKKFSESLGEIDKKYIEEAQNYRKKESWRKLALPAAACLCLMAMAGAVFLAGVKFSGKTAESGGILEEIESLSISPAVTEGTGFTEEEIQSFLAENEEYIVSSVMEYEAAVADTDNEAETAAQAARDAVISTYGYRHVSVTEDENILNLDYLNFLIIDDGNILGNATLYKDDGKIKYNVAYGGTWGETLTKLLKDNPDEDFVLIYIDYLEIAISSDNTIYFLGGEIDGLFEEDVDYYSAYKCEENTINSSILEQ